MRVCTTARIRSSRTLRARDGVDLLGLSRLDGGTSAATMAARLRMLFRASAASVECLSIPPIRRLGPRSISRFLTRGGGWQRGTCGGWSAHVEQGRYGHAAKKATWLYAFGVELPGLRWGALADRESAAVVSWCGNTTNAFDKRPRVGKAAASRTPIEFRDVLLGTARSALTERGNP
jgi:hypothetical protein